MDRGRGGIRQATDVAVVVIQGDAFASLHLETLGARLGEAHRDGRGGVLVLDDDADATSRGDGGVKDNASGGADRDRGVGERPEEGGGDRDIGHVISKFGSC